VRTRQAELTGWGRTAPSVARLVDTTDSELDGAALRDLAESRGVIARGLGRAYGDPAQNAGGTVVQLRPGQIVLDVDRGEVTAGGGVGFDELLRYLVPRGWFVPVTPGTRFITVGGAIASDIHGKNHHADGSFGVHLRSMTLLTADGERRPITEASDPSLWWATIAGMGLTGIIVDATFRVLPIETGRCLVDTERLPNLEALLERMESGDHLYRYSVAWVDMVATGPSLGRSVLTRGDHATIADLDDVGVQLDDPLEFSPPALASVPRGVPNLLNRLSVSAFNELWYRKAPRSHRGLESITGFFHPLDMVGSWNRLYGAAGFLQYQFVVPFEAVDTLRTIVREVSASGQASFLAVLKRLGDANDGMLSFPTPGWTLTMDLPAGVNGLGDLLARLDGLVLDAGGRHYLAKDATGTPSMVRAEYPRLDEWLAVRRSVDPHGMWMSDQARRLDLY
jgi:decaprenylphospho-beta-D-ribofuranose 2-oxidase